MVVMWSLQMTNNLKFSNLDTIIYLSLGLRFKPTVVLPVVSIANGQTFGFSFRWAKNLPDLVKMYLNKTHAQLLTNVSQTSNFN